MNLFEFLDEYTGQSYSDLPENGSVDVNDTDVKTYSDLPTDTTELAQKVETTNATVVMGDE